MTQILNNMNKKFDELSANNIRALVISMVEKVKKRGYLV